LTRGRIRAATAKVAPLVQERAARPHACATLNCQSRCVFDLDCFDGVEDARAVLDYAATVAKKLTNISEEAVAIGAPPASVKLNG
jgi:hypothetical protein